MNEDLSLFKCNACSTVIALYAHSVDGIYKCPSCKEAMWFKKLYLVEKNGNFLEQKELILRTEED